MAVTINAKGTSFPSFQIGKKGVTLFQGDTDTEALQLGDFLFNTTDGSIMYNGAAGWQHLVFDDISISGNTITSTSDLNLSPTGSLILADVTWPSGTGSANQVLTSTGDGGAIWAPAAASYTIGTGLSLAGDVLSHADLSTQANTAYTGSNVIQNLTFDTSGLGHVAGVTSIDLDTLYDRISTAAGKYVAKTGSTMTGNLNAPRFVMTSTQGTGTGDAVRYDHLTGSIPKQSSLISGSTNLDTILFGGFYYQSAPSPDAGGTLNYPVNLSGALTVLATGEGTFQMYTPSATADGSQRRIYYRNRWGASNTWTPWTTVYDTNFKPTAADVGALPVGGTAASATKLATARNIVLTGDATGSASFDGTADASITVVVVDNSHSHTTANVTGLDTALAGKLDLTGGTMTGALTAPNVLITEAQGVEVNSVARRDFVESLVASIPTSDVTKAYVDAQDALKVNLAGATMTGALMVDLSSAQDDGQGIEYIFKNRRQISDNDISIRAVYDVVTAIMAPGQAGAGLTMHTGGKSNASGLFQVENDHHMLVLKSPVSPYDSVHQVSTDPAQGVILGTDVQIGGNVDVTGFAVTANNFVGNASTANKWFAPRTLTIGGTGKTVDGSADVSWTVAEIGAQASDATLTAMAGAATAANTFIYFTAADTVAMATLSPFGRTLIDDVDAAAARTTLGAQAADGTLTAMAGVTTAANTMIYFSGADVAASTVLSPFGRTLIDDADATAARTTIGAQATLGFTPENAANKNAVNGYAGLDASGKISSSQLPAVAITNTFVVANETEMLALAADVGDLAIRTDLNRSFILAVAGASTLANWQELLTPTDAVLSVAGKTGAVTLVPADVGAQPVDATLTAMAGVATSADKIIYFTGADLATSATLSSFGRTLIDDADATTARATIGAQASDATLTAMAGVTTAADRIIYFNGVDTAAATPLTAFGRTLIDDADATAARTTLGAQASLGFTPENVANKNAVNGYAGLDAAGKIASSQLPAAAITKTYVVATELEMLALAANVGDVAVRTDLSKSFILAVADASLLVNWQELLTPADAVKSVAGKTGVVTLVPADVGAQPLDATLTAMAGVVTAVDKIIYFDGVDTAKSTTLSSFARTILDDTSGSAVCTTIGAQPVDATLTAMAGVVTANDKIIYFNGVDTATSATITSFGRSLIDDADAATARGTIGAAAAVHTHAIADVTGLQAGLDGKSDVGHTHSPADAGAQPLDATLTAMAGVVTAADQIIYFNGVDTALATPLTSFARTLLDDTSAATARTTLGAQASDATLTAMAGVTTAADRIIYFSGVDVAAATTLSAFGRTLIDDADAATARGTIGAAATVHTHAIADVTGLQSALDTLTAKKAEVIVSDTKPSSTVNGALWYDSVGGRLYVYYQDVDSGQWVESSPQSSPNMAGGDTELRADLALPTGAGLVGTTQGVTVQVSLDGKAAIDHTHTAAQINAVSTSGDVMSGALQVDLTNAVLVDDVEYIFKNRRRVSDDDIVVHAVYDVVTAIMVPGQAGAGLIMHTGGKTNASGLFQVENDHHMFILKAPTSPYDTVHQFSTDPVQGVIIGTDMQIDGNLDVTGYSITADSFIGTVSNAATADAWSNPVTVTLGGDATGSVELDGSGDVTLTVTIPETGSVHMSDVAPTGAVNGSLWYNTSEGVPYVLYEDADSTQWVEFVPPSAATSSAMLMETVKKLTEEIDLLKSKIAALEGGK